MAKRTKISGRRVAILRLRSGAGDIKEGKVDIKSLNAARVRIQARRVNGAAGLRGFRGLRGLQGDMGATGPQGIQGVPGPNSDPASR